MSEIVDVPIEYMLTTVDNPFNPFTRFDEWFAYDVGKGYNTSALLDRVTYSSNELSELDQSIAIQEAIDEIVKENVLGLYRKVSKEQADQLEVVADL